MKNTFFKLYLLTSYEEYHYRLYRLFIEVPWDKINLVVY